MLRTTDAAAWSRAMNYGCWYAIVRSEKTQDTLARNECQVLMCQHAVRKDTHAGLTEFFGMQWITDAAARSWHGIQASKHKNITILNTWIYQHNITIPSVILKELVVCGGCNEWRLLIRHRAVRKDTHTLACNECFGMQWITGPQRIPRADVPSCGQKRQTRWPATNASACNELRMRYSTRTYPWVLPEKKGIQHANLLQHGMEFRG